MMRRLSVYSPYLFLSAAIMLPLLLPGYILTLDLVFTPDLRGPASVTNDWLWQNFLHYLNFVLPSQVIEKIILFIIPLLSGIGMHRLIAYIRPKTNDRAWYWATYIASIFYAVNPFTYSRFMAGQYAVLLGYALMPFFVWQLLMFLDKPERSSMLKTVGIALLISVISIHSIGEMALIAIVFVAWAAVRNFGKPEAGKYALWGITAVVIFLVASSYWLVPLMMGKGSTASTINQFNSIDASTFATVGNSKVGQVVNVLKLQGFWADARNMYRLPQQQFLGWGTLRLIIWLLIGWGAVETWKHKRGLSIALVTIGVISIALATGVPQNALIHLGYREPQKFAAVVALIFAALLAFGIARLLLWISKWNNETTYYLGAGAALVIVLVFTAPMFWGFGGQLHTRQYPSDWALANTWLDQHQASADKTLFLPWHEYMSFNFSGRIIGNPAERYFDKPVIASNNPELGHLALSTNDPLKTKLDKIVNGNRSNFAAQLASQHIQYIVLAKDDDFQKYSYLDHQPSLSTAWSSATLKIYRNQAIGGK